MSVAAVTMPVSPVNARRRNTLLNSGPPGRYANTQMKAPAVANAIMPVSFLIAPTADCLRSTFFEDRGTIAATTDARAMQIRIKLAIAVTSRIVVWELNGRK